MCSRSDVGQEHDLSIHDVGRVESPAQARLDDRHLHLAFSELEERGGSQRLELRRADGRRVGSDPGDGPPKSASAPFTQMRSAQPLTCGDV